MRAVVWSARARTQYKTAIAYLFQHNESAAQRLADRVRITADGLARRPIGRPGHVPGTYEKIVQKTSYIIVYELMGGELHIHRLFHMSQDWQGWSPEDEGP